MQELRGSDSFKLASVKGEVKENVQRAGTASVLDLERDEAKRRKVRVRRGKRTGGLLKKPVRKYIWEWEGACPCSYPPGRGTFFPVRLQRFSGTRAWIG